MGVGARGRRSRGLGRWARLRVMGCLLGCLLGVAGCGDQMRQQARYDPYEPSTFFNDGTSARHPPANTVARGRANLDTHLYEGQVDGATAETLPFPVTMEVLQRGRERYGIFCAPCHGHDGYGQGMIVQRGFTPPESFHSERLRAAPPGYYFTVITRGFGAMYSYGERIPPADRWAIIAYIQALQLSQNATLDDVPAEARQQLEAPAP